jgi:primosomal protein N'
MQAVNVIINLNSKQLNNSFTYLVPEEFAVEAVFGKRVLVDFRGKRRKRLSSGYRKLNRIRN